MPIFHAGLTNPDGPLAGMLCPLCGGLGKSAALYHKSLECGLGYEPRKIRECCGVLLSWLWDSEEDYQRWYEDGEYHTTEQIANGQAPYYRRDEEALAAARSRMTYLHPFRAGAITLLDVGAGTGAFVEIAVRQGFSAEGIEPCATLAKRARMAGRSMETAAWDDWRRQGYDIITAFDVFEHLTRPAAFLQWARKSLSPKGLLVIEMPEWKSPQQQKEGWDWKHIRPRQHICLYSREAAETMFERAGFTVEAFFRPLRGSLGKACWYLSAKE